MEAFLGGSIKTECMKKLGWSLAVSFVWLGCGEGMIVNQQPVLTSTDCLPRFHPQGKICVLNVRSCTTAEGNAGQEVWDGQTFSPCRAPVMCSSDEHLEDAVCVSNVQACLVPNGSGEETWNGTAFGTCTVTGCDVGFHQENNGCAPNVVDVPDGSFVCSQGQHAEGLTCVSDVRPCTVANGSGDQTWNGTQFGPCTLKSCNANFHAESNACMPNVRGCTKDGQAGEESWDGQAYGPCVLTGCEAGKHLEGQTCVANVRSCSIANGSGQETWNGTQFGACMVKSCDASFHAAGNGCEANVRNCSIANGSGQEAWSGQAYGACTLTACNSGFQVTAGQCTASFVGQFKAPCSNSGGIDIIWVNQTPDDSNHSLIANIFATNDGSCSAANAYRTVRQYGTYTRIRPSAAVAGALEIDFDQPQLEITLLSALAVSEHNMLAECGKTDWAINTPYTFTRAQCNAGGSVTKTLNKIDGNTLYVGNFKGALDADGRPLSLNMNADSIFTRF